MNLVVSLPIIFSAISVLLVSSTSITGHQQRLDVNNINYQIHSYDDLREMRQLLLKGARRFKFDPHFMDSHPNCDARYSNSSVSSSNALTNPCFLLNHDTPNPLTTTYSSTKDLLAFLTGDIFNALVPPTDHVTIALCFKSAPDKCDSSSTRFNTWLHLADEFFSQVAQLQSTGEMRQNIEFILDGDAKPMKCLEGRWLPWKSVWIVNNKDSSDIYNEAFYSNSMEHDFYRYQILNNPENVTNWEWMSTSDVNYGKFSKSNYPYQLWEPDLEEDIAEYIALYGNSVYNNSLIKDNVHLPGFHFAINIDIAMFRLFRDSSMRKPSLAAVSKSVERQVTLNHVREGLHVSLPRTTPPHADASASVKEVKSVSMELRDNVLLLATHVQQQSGSHLTHSLVLRLMHLEETHHLVPSPSLGNTMSNGNATNTLFLSPELQESLQLSDTNTIVSVQLLSSHVIPSAGTSKEVCQEVWIATQLHTGGMMVQMCHDAEGVFRIVQTKHVSWIVTDMKTQQPSSQLLDLRPTSLSCQQPQSDDQSTSSSALSHCFLSLTSADDLTLSLIAVIVEKTGDVVISTVSSMALSSLSTSTQIEHGQVIELTDTAAAIANALVFVSSDGVIYGAVVDLTSFLAIQRENLKNPTVMTVAWSRLMVGRHISAAPLRASHATDLTQSKQVVMLLTGDGFCFNSHSHNTRSIPSVCSTVPQSTDYVLDYSLGLAEDWVRVIGSGQDTVDVCGGSQNTNNILHGTYDLGVNPHLTLMLSPSRDQDTHHVVQMLSVQGGFPTDAAYTCGCGMPLRNDGTVLAAFAIDDWVQMLLTLH